MPQRSLRKKKIQNIPSDNSEIFEKTSEKTFNCKKNIRKIITIYFQIILLYLHDIAFHKFHSKKLIINTRIEVQILKQEKKCKMCCKRYPD